MNISSQQVNPRVGKEKFEVQGLALTIMSSLAEDYTSLYHVEAESGEYTCVTRSGATGGKVHLKLAGGDDFFGDCRESMSGGIYREDWPVFEVLADKDKFKKAVRGKLNIIVEYRVIEDEIPVWYQAKVVKLTGADRKTFFAIGVKNVDALRKKQHQYEESLAVSSYFLAPYECVYYVNLETGAWNSNKQSERITKKYPRSENYRETLRMYIQKEVYLEDRKLVRILMDPEEIMDRLERTPSFNFTFRTGLKDEKIVRCEVIRGADENHAAFGFMDITAEIKEQRKRLQREVKEHDLADQQRTMKSFGDMVNAALWNMRINGRNVVFDVEWSNEFRHMLGYEQDEEDFPNVLDAWTDTIYTEDKERVMEYFNKSIAITNYKDFIFDIEFRCNKKNGEVHWFRSVGRMESEGRGFRSIYGIFYDITTSKALEEQRERLAEALHMAEAANKAKTIFLSNMSHDIRTPMNAIIGYTNMAKGTLDNKAQTEDYLGKISQSSDHLLSLINDVLDMSCIESGKMNLNEADENITEIINTLNNIISSDAKTKQLSFSVEVSDLKNELIVCDRLRLNQALLNILSNAVKYTPAGGIVTMKVAEKGERRDGFATYEFRVKDNGLGMTKEFLEHLYDPFTRVSSSTISGIQGTGLGMAITKNIVEMMGGIIEVVSEPDKGTEVTVRFDFKLQDVSDATELDKQPHAEVYDFTGKKVLLVEDNPLNREIATDILEDEGMILDFAEDGDIAVEKMKNFHKGTYDVVLMDIQMPHMNGYEATRAIRKLSDECAQVPIIAMTANAFNEDRKLALAAGMNEHVAKPIDIAKLKDALARFLL